MEKTLLEGIYKYGKLSFIFQNFMLKNWYSILVLIVMRKQWQKHFEIIPNKTKQIQIENYLG
jgi:hypothetical protein